MRNKYARVNHAPTITDLINAHRRESPFYGLCEAETAAKFEQMLQNARRWVDSDEYRNPAPLGPIRVEFDEDGVPTYLD